MVYMGSHYGWSMKQEVQPFSWCRKLRKSTLRQARQRNSYWGWLGSIMSVLQNNNKLMSQGPGEMAAVLVEMRNCIQQCSLVNSKREGLGIIISDQGNILIGQWHEGKLDGWYASLTENTQAYGTMAKGELQGFNVVQVDENLTVCGMFSKNLINDVCLLTSADKYQIAKFKKGYRQQIIEKGSYHRETVYDIIKKYFESQILGLRKFISYQLQMNEGKVAEIEINSMYRYYGFVNEEKTYGEGLGFVFKNDMLYNCGVFKATELSGLGRLYIKDEIQDGVFSAGVLQGEGISYDYSSNQYICGNFSSKENDFERGYGYPDKQVKKIRRQSHLRSINFLNDVFVYDRVAKIKIGDIMPQFQTSKDYQTESVYDARSASPYKPSKSPSRKSIHSTKPSKYYISDSSPLKRMLKDYDKESSHYTPQKKPNVDNRTKSPLNARPGEMSRRLANKEETIFKPPTPASNISRQIYQREPQQTQPTYEEDSLVKKDTFDMIRHMEEIQRSKREDLARVSRKPLKR